MFSFNNTLLKTDPKLGSDEFTPPQQPPQQIYKQYDPLKDLPENPLFYTGKHVYNIPTTIEHLFEEEAHKTRRGISENLTFCTGVSFLSGSIIGGVKGTLEGLKAAERGDSFKIRVNRVLNTGGSVGRRIGNKAGVLGLVYAGMDSGISHLRGGDDTVGNVLSGAGTGFLFRSVAGFRSAAVGGVLGGVAAAAIVGGSVLAKKYAI